MIGKERKIYLDILRILACFTVIFNHSSGYHFFMDEPYNWRLWIHTFCSMIIRFNVPIFFMISGALLIGKKESIKDLMLKRVFRMVLVVVVFSIPVYLKLYKYWGTSFSDFFVKLRSDAMTYQYWFMYSYVSFLLILPILRFCADKIEKEHVIYLIVFRFIFATLIPLIKVGNPDFYLYGVSMVMAQTDIIFYPILGFYLANKLNIEKINLKRILLCVVGIIMCVFAQTALTIFICPNGQYDERFTGILDYAVAIFIFIAIRGYIENISIGDKTRKVITYIGGLTFGIYMFEPILNEYIYNVYDFNKMGSFKGSYIYCVVAMVVCGVVVAILKKLPLIKKLL